MEAGLSRKKITINWWFDRDINEDRGRSGWVQARLGQPKTPFSEVGLPEKEKESVGQVLAAI